LIKFVNSCFLVLVCLGSCVQAGQQAKDNADGAVSFAKDVAPIIVAKCGKCHVANSRGSYEIESYSALMSSDSITPKDPGDSNFIQVIESGDMPKGGLKVSDSELETLKKWITQGAKFDGKDKKKALMEPVAGGGGRGQRGGRLKAVEQNPQAVGDEGVAWYVTWTPIRRTVCSRRKSLLKPPAILFAFELRLTKTRKVKS